MNALKHGRYARCLTRCLERAGENKQLGLYWNIVGTISRHFRVDWNHEQSKAECLARQVWCYGWKSWLRRQAVAQLRTNPGSPQNSATSKNNVRMRIYIRASRRAKGLTFDFGPRRRRRLTARVIPILSAAELYALRLLAQLIFLEGGGEKTNLNRSQNWGMASCKSC
jgi:hypothetical protein